MGATSAFHEGGDHVAVRSGKLAGELAATDSLARYNEAWKAAIGEEIRRNVAMADLVADFGPREWDEIFGTVNRMVTAEGPLWRQAVAGGLGGLTLFAGYKGRKFRLRDGGYVQLRADEYVV
jgi:electron-transferring-flavoprotein dehydrogenase